MSRPALHPLGALLAVLAVAGCNNPESPLNATGGIGGGLGKANPAVVTACTQRADQVYDQRNRAEIYSPQSSVNSPYSANYIPGMTDRGLSTKYAHDSMIRDCVRNTGTETNRTVPPANSATGPVVRP
jgi:hypothetical protein